MTNKNHIVQLDKLLTRLSTYTTFIADISNFVAHLKEKNKSPLTINTYLQDLLTCVQFFHNNTQPLKQLPADIKQWRLFLQHLNQKVKPNTQRKILHSLKAFADYHLFILPVIKKLQLPKTTKTMPKPISGEAIQLLLSQPLNKWEDYRNRALWTLLYGCGLRISEALGLFTNCLSFDITSLSVLGKGNKTRTLPLLDIVKDSLNDYLKHRPHTTHHFLFIDNKHKPLTRIQAAHLITKLKNQLGLPAHTSCHKLRHSFVSHMIEQGASLKAIQKLVGHASLSTIQSYASISVQHLAKTHQKGAANWEESES